MKERKEGKEAKALIACAVLYLEHQKRKKKMQRIELGRCHGLTQLQTLKINEISKPKMAATIGSQLQELRPS